MNSNGILSEMAERFRLTGAGMASAGAGCKMCGFVTRGTSLSSARFRIYNKLPKDVSLKNPGEFLRYPEDGFLDW